MNTFSRTIDNWVYSSCFTYYYIKNNPVKQECQADLPPNIGPGDMLCFVGLDMPPSLIHFLC